MACVVGLDAADCISDHWLPPLNGRAEPKGGHAPCPVCGIPRALSLWADGAKVAWNLHCEPRCERDAASKVIAAKVACHAPIGRHRKPSVDADEIEALALDRSVTINALRLGVLEGLGMSTKKAAEKLKLPKRTFYDAVRILAQSRRSRGVRILALDADASSAKPRTEPQVKRPDKAA